MKKNKKRIFFIVSLSLLLVFMLSIIVHLTSVEISDIESIEVNKPVQLFQQYFNYKINFTDKSIIYEKKDCGEIETFCTNFTDKNAEYFVKRANLYGFFSWKEGYANLNVEDGKTVDIVIKFQDGSTQEINCYAKFPLTYDLMADVFYEAFGYNIL